MRVRLVSIAMLSRVAELVLKLRENYFKVIIVTSGAIGVGCMRLGLKERPNEIAAKQALAAVGQNYLMKYVNSLAALCSSSNSKNVICSPH